MADGTLALDPRSTSTTRHSPSIKKSRAKGKTVYAQSQGVKRQGASFRPGTGPPRDRKGGLCGHGAIRRLAPPRCMVFGGLRANALFPHARAVAPMAVEAAHLAE